MTDIITPQVGDKVYLKTVTARLNIFGVVSDLDTPDQVSATLELFGGNGVMSLAALMGPTGPAGNNAPLPRLMPDTITDPDDLPNSLTDDDVDAGKYWIIEDLDELGNVLGSKAYMWNRDHWQVFQMGTEGPVGPVPIVTPNVVLLDPDDDALQSHITVTGDDFHPSWTLYLKAPRGPQGVMGEMEELTNFDGSTPAETGDVPTFNEATNKWEPRPSGNIIPKFWTMPEASFIDVPLAFGTSVPLGSFIVPPQEWDTVPYVVGHLRITGVEFDIDPFIIGAEVRLGSPTGVLVARGFGNVSTYVALTPHASTPSTPNDAITPDNGRAVIPAGSTGAAATLYVNAFNDGVTGIYHFEKRGAQLSIQLLPV